MLILFCPVFIICMKSRHWYEFVWRENPFKDFWHWLLWSWCINKQNLLAFFSQISKLCTDLFSYNCTVFHNPDQKRISLFSINLVDQFWIIQCLEYKLENCQGISWLILLCLLCYHLTFLHWPHGLKTKFHASVDDLFGHRATFLSIRKTLNLSYNIDLVILYV